MLFLNVSNYFPADMLYISQDMNLYQLRSLFLVLLYCCLNLAQFFLCQSGYGWIRLCKKSPLFRMTVGVLINIECRVWAPNIEYDREKGKGFVHFELLIDWDPRLGSVRLQPVTKQRIRQNHLDRKLLKNCWSPGTTEVFGGNFCACSRLQLIVHLRVRYVRQSVAVIITLS
jgi:hypothetical protein